MFGVGVAGRLTYCCSGSDRNSAACRARPHAGSASVPLQLHLAARRQEVQARWAPAVRSIPPLQLGSTVSCACTGPLRHVPLQFCHLPSLQAYALLLVLASGCRPVCAPATKQAAAAAGAHLAQGLAINLLAHALVVEGAPAGTQQKLGNQRAARPLREQLTARRMAPSSASSLFAGSWLSKHAQLGVILNLQLLLAPRGGEGDVELLRAATAGGVAAVRRAGSGTALGGGAAARLQVQPAVWSALPGACRWREACAGWALGPAAQAALHDCRGWTWAAWLPLGAAPQLMGPAGAAGSPAAPHALAISRDVPGSAPCCLKLAARSSKWPGRGFQRTGAGLEPG